MNILSLFDGISAGRLALNRAGIKIDKYYASEIDKYAIKIAQKNYPDTIQLEDINNWQSWKLPKIDLIIGGSPCTNLSRAGDKTGLKEGNESSLLYRFIDILKFYNPRYFLLENVKMKKEWEDEITKLIGVEDILINSSLVSAQNRLRLYWTNIPNIKQPEDKNIFLKDIILGDVEPVVLHNLYGGFKEDCARIFINKSPTIRTSKGGGHIPSFVKKNSENKNNYIKNILEKNSFEGFKVLNRFGKEKRNDKSGCLTSSPTNHSGGNHSDMDILCFGDPKKIDYSNSGRILFKTNSQNIFWRRYLPIECERLQTIPDNYTQGISNTQRYNCIGNSWTVDVVAHIFSFMKEDMEK